MQLCDCIIIVIMFSCIYMHIYVYLVLLTSDKGLLYSVHYDKNVTWLHYGADSRDF